MDVAVVGLDDCVKVVSLFTRSELVTFALPAACVACVDGDLFVAHRDKPLLYRYQLHCSVQTPAKVVLPDKITALCGAHCGAGFLYAGVAHSLYVWCTKSARCLSISARHYQPITRIETDATFTVTGSDDGFVCVYLTADLLQVHGGAELKPKCVINAHSLPLTDLTLRSGVVYTASVDFSVKVWDLTPLTNVEQTKQVQQGRLLKATIQYPEPIRSIDLDALCLTLVAAGESGTIYSSMLSTMNNIDSKTDNKMCRKLRYNISSSELILMEDKQITIRCAQSRTMLKTISFTKGVNFFTIELDKWGLCEKRQGPSRRNAQSKPFAHQVSSDDYVVSFDSVKKIHCPLLDVVGYHDLNQAEPSAPLSESNDHESIELRKQVELLERKNEEMYRKLVESHLN